jgi:endonuclease/exonuclease/phosphatase family metal-dependent hydrolase
VPPLRLLSYNIKYGGTGREDAIASVIREAAPDVVVLQEATDPTVVRRLASATGLLHSGSRAGHSTGFLSREPVAAHAWHHPPGARHAFLEVVLANDVGRVYGLHLNAWFSKWSERRRVHEIRALLHSIREHQHGFHVIAGDFNALAPGAPLNVDKLPRWIQAMVWMSGRDIARDTIGVMLEAKYVDAFRRLHPDDAGYTFPTWDPHTRFDYLFTPERYAERLARCEVLLGARDAKVASDHFPLLIELDLSV